MTLLLSISLTAACTAVTPPPVAEHLAPQAPGIGFQAEAPASSLATSATSHLPSPVVEPAPAASQTPAAASEPVATRIKRQHKYVNVRPDPSSEKKPAAVLMGGKRIEVVGEQENWVKIRWQRGKKELEGWVFKRFVEGYE
jgi:hypothetical protein